MSGFPVFIWRFAQVEFDEARWELRVGGKLLELEPRPLEVLLHLLRHAGEVVSREELLEAVYGHQHIGEGALANAIAKLRKALDDDEQTIITTVHRVGYRLVAPVKRAPVQGIGRHPLLLKTGDTVPRREHWKLQRPLGAGRDTEVWLAAHEKTREQRVFKFSPGGQRLSALKREATLFRVIKETLGEREDFVKVLDWNFDELPFFLECEYGGQNLVEWAESSGGVVMLALEQRIALAEQVAVTVAAAHSAGVLHKDLKPANVLVYQDSSGSWHTRLTDFGSGRLLDPDRLAELGITQLGFTQTQSVASDSRTGTPLYLAPEVVAGQSPTTVSDVYSLGVMLFQLAVGDLRRAISPGWEHEVADEVLRSDIAQAASGDPAKRMSSAAELATRLSELAERRAALSREREAAAQAKELKSRLDRTRARRPWLIAAGTTLMIGLAVSLWFFRAAASARDEARKETKIAEAVTHFFNQGVLSSASPWAQGNHKDLTVSEAIDLAAAHVDEQFVSDPETAAAIHLTIGNLYLARANLDLAEREIRKAVGIYQSTLGAADPQTLRATQTLVSLLVGADKLTQARSQLENLDQVIHEAYGDQPPGDVAARNDRAHAAYYDAVQQYDKLVPVLEKLASSNPPGASEPVVAARWRLLLAGNYPRIGRFTDSNQLFERVLGDLRNAHAENSYTYASALSASGGSLFLQGRYAEAEGVFRESKQLIEASQGKEAGIDSLVYLCSVEWKLGKVQQALNDCAVAYEDIAHHFGANHHWVLVRLGYLGIVEFEAGKRDSGLRDLELAADKTEKILGWASPQVQYFRYYLAEDSLRAGLEPSRLAGLVAGLDPGILRYWSPSEDWGAKLKTLKGRLLLAERHG